MKIGHHNAHMRGHQWSFRDVPGCVLWLDAARAVSASAGVLSAWGDSGPQHHDGAVIDAPAHSASGFASRSAAYVTADGSNDGIDLGTHADFEPGLGSYAVFAGVRFLAGGGTDYDAIFSKGSDVFGTGGIRCFRTSAKTLALYYNASSSYTASTATLNDSVDAVLCWGVDAVDGKVLYAINGTRERIAVTVATTGSNSTHARVGIGIPPDYPANVRIAGVGMIKRTASDHIADSEVADIVARLRDKWGI